MFMILFTVLLLQTLEIQESLQRLLKATWQDKASMRSTETHQVLFMATLCQGPRGDVTSLYMICIYVSIQ